MYNTLTTKANRKTFADVKERLEILGWLEFQNINAYHEEYLKREDIDIIDWLRVFFYCNRCYTTIRWSNRYQKYVDLKNNSSNNTDTNRSIVDIYLATKYYNPRFADLEFLYKSLYQFGQNDIAVSTVICHVINKRVWYIRNWAMSLNEFMSIRRYPLTGNILKNELTNHADELGTKYSFENDEVKLLYRC